ncbi:DNA adenine methylase [Desulfofundulus thermosubterraneus]|nr:DNA adenine methylase [Desulfofundulus thermosubterraneus]
MQERKGRCLIKSPLKWVGGKGQLIPQFEPFFPPKVREMAEPFFGGGAVFFHLQPSWAFLVDSNEELINFYLVLRDRLEELLVDLRYHKNSAEYYYWIRSVDPATLNPVQRASRFLYLNKTGYNGLWRVNKKGQYNVPFGRYKYPKIVDEEKLSKASAALKNAEIRCGDFSLVLEVARPGMFIYLDPPYYPLSETSNFTSYTAGQFHERDQLRLADLFRELDRRGCLVMLSNSDTQFVRKLYVGYDIKIVYARRAINCRGDRRGAVTELVIRNYE